MKMTPSDRTYTALLSVSVLICNSILHPEPQILDFIVHEFNPLALDHGVQHDPEAAGKPGGCLLVDVDQLIEELGRILGTMPVSELQSPHEEIAHEDELYTCLDLYDDGEPFELPARDLTHPFQTLRLGLVRQHTLDVVDGNHHESIEYRVHRESTIAIDDEGYPAGWATKIADVTIPEGRFEDDEDGD